MKVRTPEERRAYYAKRKAQGRPIKSGPSGKCGPRHPIGIDGEGVTDKNGNHRYVMLTYSDATGENAGTVEAKLGEHLTTDECFDFLWQMFQDNPHALFFGFSLGYDWSKIYEDMSNQAIYQLYRPETRAFMPGGKKRWPVKYKDWRINLDGPQCTKIQLKGYKPPFKKWHKGVEIWDIFRFFGCSFVKAISEEGWNVGTEEERQLIKAMKKRRSQFKDTDRAEMRRYNLLECKLLAQMARKLIDAHRDIRTASLPEGLTLTRYDGPGSTVSALFKAWELPKIFERLKERESKYSEHLRAAIGAAMFGGRFENAVIGEVKVGYPFDINSAYPCEICSLPCLLCGKWRRTKKEPSQGSIALYRYKLLSDNKRHHWGPFPFRFDDGSICFPIESDGGWVWGQEYWAAKNTGLWPGIEFIEAYVFDKKCNHLPPLRNIYELYLRRGEVGKYSGEGMALKLGMNSAYGKMAQSVGRAPFNSWIYAGMITAGTRGKLLQLLGIAGEKKVLAMATDSVLLIEKVVPPPAPKTGAENAAKPLGGWDAEKFGPLFLIRPGISLGLKTRARGIGGEKLDEQGEKVKKAWKYYQKRKDREDGGVVLKDVTRFFGARQGIHYKESTGEFIRSEEYGKWITRPQILSFTPFPKRASIRPDGTMTLRKIEKGIESMPYDPALLTEEKKQALELAKIMFDQPDLDDDVEDYDE